MTDWKTVDFFTDASLLADPYEYFDQLREQGPVLPLPHLGVVAVTGFEEIFEVYRDPETFSSCNSVVGPFAPFSVPLEGDDVTELVAAHRHELPLHEHIITLDPPEHTNERALLMRLLTPRRLRDNEAFMWRLADQQLDEVVPAGAGELIQGFAQPFALLVVADLLGVPESEHEQFRQGFGLSGTVGDVRADDGGQPGDNPLWWLDEWFSGYIEQRREEPKEDVLTQLALATYPDGSTPEVMAVVRTATFLFAAGQETTARLIGAALLHLAEHPEVQERVRADRSLIVPLLEELLRTESPVKCDFRLARKTATVGGVEIPAGTPVMLLNGAANRDPRRFECPHEVQVDRPDAAAHVAFGRGVHACPGGSLSRAEGRVSMERILDRMGDIRLSEEHHGPPGDRQLPYEPSWVLRGLTSLNLEWEPLEAAPRTASGPT